MLASPSCLHPLLGAPQVPNTSPGFLCSLCCLLVSDGSIFCTIPQPCYALLLSCPAPEDAAPLAGFLAQPEAPLSSPRARDEPGLLPLAFPSPSSTSQPASSSDSWASSLSDRTGTFQSCLQPNTTQRAEQGLRDARATSGSHHSPHPLSQCLSYQGPQER